MNQCVSDNFMLFHSAEESRTWWELALFTSIAYAGCSLNFVLIISVLKEKSLRTSPTYIVLVNLAVADLLSLIVAPSALVYGQFVDVIPDTSCQFTVFFFRVTMAISAYTIVIFSILRYLLIGHPLFSRVHVTASRVSFACAALWPLFLAENAFCFLAVVFGQVQTRDCFFLTCIFKPEYDLALGILTLPDFILPFLLITGFQAAKLARLRKREIKEVTQGSQRTVSARAVMAIVIAYVVCYLPYNVMLLTNYLLRIEFTNSTYPILILLSSLSLINSIFNPILYFFLSRRQTTLCSRCRK